MRLYIFIAFIVFLSLNTNCSDGIIDIPDEEVITPSDSTITEDSDSIIDVAQIKDYDKYYKPLEFKSMNMLHRDSKWSWFRSAQSEHFFLFWEPEFGEDPNSETLEEELRVDIDDLLLKAEEFYKLNVEKLKFVETGENKSYLDKYKMQIYLFYQKEWLATGSGYDNVIGALWINPSTCKPVGATIAHEIGHSFQYQVYCDKLYQGIENNYKSGFRYGYEGSNGNNGFWEQCAQWQALQSYPDELFSTYQFDVWISNCHRHFCHEYMRYASYWLHYYWSEKHGLEVVSDIWNNSYYPEDPIMTYMRRYCSNDWEKMKTELYEYAARMATFDIDVIRDYSSSYIGKYFTTLYPQNDGYYQVAYSDCPGSTGFNVIELNVPNNERIVSAEFKGLLPGAKLADIDPGNYLESDAVKGTVSVYNDINPNNAGWMYSFVALTSDGQRIYGNVNNENCAKTDFNIPEGTEKLYFVVMGAPHSYTPHPWDEKEINDEQFPYMVKFLNTDLKGNVSISPDSKPVNLKLEYDLSLNKSSTDYSGITLKLDLNNGLEEIAQALVLQPNRISELLLAPKQFPQEGKIAFAAINSDDSLDFETTANGYGFWYDSNGNTIGWSESNDSKIFVEFNISNFEFTIGQYPGKLNSGDNITVKTALVYLKDDVEYVITFIFNVLVE